MRLSAIIGLTTALVLVGWAAANPTATPKLRVITTSPLVVSGTGFVARERVAITALSSVRSRVVRLRASVRGTFRARLGRFTQPCGKPWAVRARGSSGRVALVRLPAPPCVPPPIR